MILDISLSADNMEKFNTHLKSTDSKLGMAFSVLVLQVRVIIISRSSYSRSLIVRIMASDIN